MILRRYFTLTLCVYFAAHLWGHDIRELILPKEGRTGFTLMAPTQTGILFSNELADSRAANNRNLLSGSGVAAGDFDGDGWCDLYFCGLDNHNVLYRNLGGWKFEDVTERAGVACAQWDCTGAAFADVDGDGDLDLLVNTLGNGTHLFVNEGGVFVERTAEAGLASSNASTSMALADIDGDGDLDLYVTNFRRNTVRDRPATRFTIEYINNVPTVTRVDGRTVTSPDLTNRFVVVPETGQVLENGEADVLYENDGHGRFAPISFTGGRFLDENGNALRSPPLDWGLSVQCYDFTGDRAPEIYVCNDYTSPDRIWVNDGRGNFRALPPLALRRTSLSSMGVDFADINRDGPVDFVVVDMFSQGHSKRQVQVGDLAPYIYPPGQIETRPQIAQNTLQLNRGDATFMEVAQFCGLEASGWSWCPLFMDVDLDGWEDLLISNGHRRDFQNADAAARIQKALAAQEISNSDQAKIMQLFPPLHAVKAAFRNNGDLTFADAAGNWGFNSTNLAHGMVAADLDNDGDLDVIMNNLGAPATLYRNDSVAPRVMVRLKGAAPNTFGVGAKVTLRGENVGQSQEIICGGRYLSGGPMERVFATAGQKRLLVEVLWRSGKRTVLKDVPANSVCYIDETE